MNRIIMLMKNNAELTFEPQSAPPQCILWAIFGGFPGFPHVLGKPTEKQCRDLSDCMSVTARKCE